VEEGVSIRRSIWISSIITLVVLAVFVGISAVIPRPQNQTGLLLMGIFLAIIPALVWMGFFNQQDRAEPEPKRLIARTFAFGALAAGAAAVPFASQVANDTIVQYPNIIVKVVLTILSVALLQEVLKVAMVRYVVLGTPEFDRHPDGIVYGLASGLGFATIMTIAYVVREGGVIPLAGAIRAVDNALVHGALGAVTGYYIGRVKIDGKSVRWFAVGLAVTTLINGIYQSAQRELESQFNYNLLLDLVGAVILALVVGAVLFYFFRLAMRRAVGDLNTVSIQAHARAKDMPWDIALRYDWLLAAAAALALLVGLGAGAFARSRSLSFTGDGLPLSFTYPAGWAAESGSIGNFVIRDIKAGGLLKPSITVETEKVDPETGLDLLVAQRTVSLQANRTFFVEQGDWEELTVAGEPAFSRRYEYAMKLPNSGPPIVLWGVETYVRNGGQMYIVRYEAQPEYFEDDLPYYQRLVRSLRFQEAQ
jgi:protease PrsW